MAVESNESTEDWDQYSYIVSSEYRVTTIDRLADGPATPTQIASDESVRVTHISRALQELREKNIIDLLVSDDRKRGRVYGLTEKGRSVYELVEQHHLGSA